MAFTGKCTYTAGTTIPEVAEDVSDLVSILSPHETPLLDALGDPLHAATSTRHEWLDDELLPNFDVINQPGLNDTALNTTSITVANGGRFRVGDQVQGNALHEVMFVTGVTGNTLTLVRGYGGSAKHALTDALKLRILGNAALEGSDADAARFTIRTRRSNYTQIFSAAVQVSGTEAAVRQIAVADEMSYQTTNRLRELLRDLENTVINGVAPTASPQGSATVRRTLQGIIGNIVTNTLVPGGGYVPSDAALSEDHINGALRTVWETAGNKPDLIVCGGGQKRRINGFIQTNQRFVPGNETFKNMVSTYESDFGVCRVVLSRYVPADTVLFLDSSRISVLPLAGRSFQFKPLATTGDYESGEVLGEYTVELRNEKGHCVLSGLDV
jgi:hypothetical protein